MSHSQRAVVLGLLLLCGAAARGEIFKCTGANGAVQFTDHPCDTDATVIPRKAAPAEADGPDEHMRKTQRLLDAMRQEREQAAQQKAEQQAEAEKRKRECLNARDDLRNITQASHLYRLDEQGNRVILSDEERTRATDDTRARVAQWCK
jgi:Domain of unknown function (DUF4124)